MLYWKTFVAMCVSCWFLALGIASVILLGVFGVVHLTFGLWTIVVVGFLILVMASLICMFMMDAELKERRLRSDGRKSN